MDTTELVPKYSSGDFTQAFRALLPKGEYWQDTESPELQNTIEAMAIDFKATHDDIELSLLTKFDEALFGWKLSDYQNLLDRTTGEGGGRVFDDIKTPNLIYASVDDNHRAVCVKAWKVFEEQRLPHTEITWTYQSKVDYCHQIASCRHIRNRHKYEVTQ
ncbi:MULTISPECIES: hypothetical protein [unclassified Vibrio]|uniref:hypothetical protein n=1 Tax=unclassified Vibrio TaxID=2614977 RepID=UPI001360D7AB|nr:MULTISPECIES: hypothetical protein [unclassified Vibrio]NAW58754.1 hypothetical protein [Vibrio sp. V36_P2S2PM302]NAX27187.1 hypothetical protein [Vibrio sp. V38_P2S17PM301]NAX32181.1 hypothetical protein [Vibrio sp. V37_P2S8PM304]